MLEHKQHKHFLYVPRCDFCVPDVYLMWMPESRKLPRPLVRYVIASSVLEMSLSGSKERFTLVVF